MELHGLLCSASNIRLSIVSPAGMACSAVSLHWWSHEVNNLFPINEKISCIRKGTQLKVKRAAVASFRQNYFSVMDGDFHRLQGKHLVS